MHDLHKIITNGSFTYPDYVEGLLSVESKDIINRMLVINPKERISIPEILSHPWMIDTDEMTYENEMLDRREMYAISQNTFSSTTSDGG
jgi:serine/threonine protein kinase